VNISSIIINSLQYVVNIFTAHALLGGLMNRLNFPRHSLLLAIAMLACTLTIASPVFAEQRHEQKQNSAANMVPLAAPFLKVSGKKPNILFVIMDDVGIDQLSVLGYGGDNPIPTPTINAIAQKGLRFRNTWSLPECSNGRMALLTGRFPFRTNVYQAIGQNDLANSQVSPYDVTVARMLKNAGYKSGLFGKYHLGGPENNEAEYGGPRSVGWDYFYGWISGLPASIDKTAGGADADGPYSCGFVPSTAREVNGEGADQGACFTPDKTCLDITGNDANGNSPGLRCLSNGGILVPNMRCTDSEADAAAASLDFTKENAHYVSQVIINGVGEPQVVDVDDPRGRTYRSTIEVDAAIDWIQAMNLKSSPWMATVSFSSDHTPLQPPPGHLLSADTRERLAITFRTIGTDCTNILVQRLLSDAMIEAMDSELGRLLVATGIAKKEGGQLSYDPQQTNTMIVIVGDNGSFGTTVKAPFDIPRSKASPYQTGVWVPLVVSGPMVKKPNRDVPHLTSATDVYGLFGEVAGLNPRKVSAPRNIDSEPMLPYLLNPNQKSIRRFNFTQGGLNIQKDNAHNGPCVIGRTDDAGGSCSQTPINKGVCEDNGGVWWGEGADDPSAYAVVKECWEVNKAIYDRVGSSIYEASKVDQSQQVYYAARDDRFKLIISNWLDFDPAKNLNGATQETLEELYEVNESKNDLTLKLDEEGKALYKKSNDGVTDSLNTVPGAAKSKKALEAYLGKLFASEPPCPGDGNDDGVVRKDDVKGHNDSWGGSSVFDFDYDSTTDEDDLALIKSKLGKKCH
jgi:hypothetical protein